MPDTVEIKGRCVSFESGDGWQCECPAFAEDSDCEHVRAAATLRTLERQAKGMGGSDIRQ